MPIMAAAPVMRFCGAAVGHDVVGLAVAMMGLAVVAIGGAAPVMTVMTEMMFARSAENADAQIGVRKVMGMAEVGVRITIPVVGCGIAAADYQRERCDHHSEPK